MKYSEIINSKVVTQSGELIGAVDDFEIDKVSYRLTRILVSGGIFKVLLRGKLIISSNQIVSIGKNIIIVKDAAANSKVDSKKDKSKLVRAGVMNKEAK
tara:strand:- start:85 stop:381 length:297 start_codon:yes stop_codon:yes gene_type:complete